MEYRYKISGRHPGTHAGGCYHTSHDGKVKADTPKKALLAALAIEFGDGEIGEYLPVLGDDLVPALVGSLTESQSGESGWVDKETLEEQWGSLEDGKMCFRLDTGGHTFDVELFEIGEVGGTATLTNKDGETQASFPTCNSYKELRSELSKLPVTWYPDLIRSMVEAAYEKDVFKDGGASRLVRQVEDRLGKGGQNG